MLLDHLLDNSLRLKPGEKVEFLQYGILGDVGSQSALLCNNFRLYSTAF
jgi:hypothetical protein